MFLINSFEIIGTIAFAISGALIGIEKKLDLFGVMFLAITTAVGGGIFRDIIIGNTPPTAFINPASCVISIATALITFYFYKKLHKLKNIIVISDALGLGVFTAVGANTAVTHEMNYAFIVVSMGLITGVGGGILRDVFVKDIPFVFRKEIYAVASILGALCFFFTYNYLSEAMSLYISFIVTFIIRILSMIYNLNLPVPQNKENSSAM
ncbi:trimeric intracellular cation channel family protein [Clostridium sp. YIM B02515]|uniref:Trimeric intracellular cation channel family protein n=1 Tax=Clostridium rhizosphaerae TaxID=2803861 RepID=A0ABS1TD89_9CLOT|nr:trimeric intracellular cation channel family protein [Clostridium rhizosphaerae]MBL4937323.1 trimeric intracellular cation channel family protein [Clostridium rhizosphaerae]